MTEEVIEIEKRTSQNSLRYMYYIIFRHKWKMVLFFLAVFLTALLSTLCSTEIYRSEAKLLVRLGRESVTLDPTATTGQIIPVSQSRESEINSELEILKSWELAEKVVDAIGVEAFYAGSAGELSRYDGNLSERRAGYKIIRKIKSRLRDIKMRFEPTGQLSAREKVILVLLEELKIEALRDSSIISITYEQQDPKLAQIVITKLIDLYLEKHITVHQTPGSHQFFLQQSDHLRNKLTLSENELRDLKDKTGVSSLEEQRIVVLNRIGELELETGDSEAELVASEAKVQILQEILAGIPETLVIQEASGFSDHASDLMRAKLYELQLKEQEVKSKFAEGSYQVQMIHQEVVAAKELLEKEKAKSGRTEVIKGINDTYKQVQSALFAEQASLLSLQAKVENLREQLADAREELKNFNDADLKITPLRREISIQEANYRRYSENLEQARIDHALEGEKISNISVVQSATLPITPVQARKSLTLVLGFFLGIFGAVGLALLSEFLDHSIKTPEEVEERLQLPALAYIPRVRANRVVPTKKQQKTPNSGSQSVKGKSTQWSIPAKIREHYSVFREELLLKSSGCRKEPYVLAVIGCRSGEGVSTVAANISAMFAQNGGGRSLLIDANIKCPSVHRFFDTRLSPGLANIIVLDDKYKDIIVSWRVRNLHILTAGTTNGFPSGIFNSDQFTRLINSLKKDYNYVVIDMPAVRETSSAARLASLCDGVVLIVGAERLRWEVVDRMKKQLLKWNANVLGVVLNKRRFHIPGWLYRTL